MKCERHPEEDAIGVCMACGRGVCASCQVPYRGVLHCPACLQAGRLAPGPGAGVPRRARGRPSRTLLLAGMVGSVVLFVGAVSTLALRALFMGATFAGGAVERPDSPLAPFFAGTSVAAASLLGLGVLLLSVGLVGLYWNYGQATAPATAAMVLSASALYLPRLPPLSPIGGPGAFPLLVPALAAEILWGAAWVLTGVNLLLLPRLLSGGKDVPVVAGSFWIVAGVLLGPSWVTSTPLAGFPSPSPVTSTTEPSRRP